MPQLAAVLQQVQCLDGHALFLQAGLDAVACLQRGLPHDHLDSHTPWNCPVAIAGRQRHLLKGL